MNQPDPQPADADPDEVRADHIRRVHRALVYIHDHLAQPLAIESIARVAHFSPSHFSYVFRGIVGESVWQFVRRLRLERGASLLRRTERSVGDISLACGFETQAAFTKAFRQAFGRSPASFRALRVARVELFAPTDLHDAPPDMFTPIPDRSANLNVRVEQRPALSLACVRHVGPYEATWRAWGRLLTWAWRRGRLGSACQFYGIAYDDDSLVPPERLRYDAAIAVEANFRGEGAIAALTLEAGEFAVATAEVRTFDEYMRVGEEFLTHWLPCSGYALRAFYEIDRYFLPTGVLRNLLRLLVPGFFPVMRVELAVPVFVGSFDRSIFV